MREGPPAAERLENVADEMLASAFCADWHDDPDVGVREVQRIKKLFVCRLVEFLHDELRRDRDARNGSAPQISTSQQAEMQPNGDAAGCGAGTVVGTPK